MRPPNVPAKEAQGDLFRPRLDQILNRQHPLFPLANPIDWRCFDSAFGPLFVENIGRPGLPTRLITGLHHLMHAFNESDESVVCRFLGNPCCQYFCGFEYFPEEDHETRNRAMACRKSRHRTDVGPSEVG